MGTLLGAGNQVFETLLHALSRRNDACPRPNLRLGPFQKHGLMVIVTFWMDAVQYPDLEDGPTVDLALRNFRHLVRQEKGHPAILMWAIGNEPNHPDADYSFYSDLSRFFSFMEHIRRVRSPPPLFRFCRVLMSGPPWARHRAHDNMEQPV